MEIIIASRNLGKIREFRAMLHEAHEVDVDSLLAFPDYEPPEETGDTFEENARIKAIDVAKTLGKVVLADDSGLVVPVLGGGPGVLSRRYAGEDATDRENRQKLLKVLEAKEGLERQAYFECWLVLASPEGEVLKVSSGRCEGSIANQEKGRNGFGYDALFIKNDYDKTFAELTDDVKNRVSHRRKAIDGMLPFLENLAHSKR